MTDLATLSETQRQGEATRAAMGLQLRARPLWSGPDRFAPGITQQFVQPYRMRGVNSPNQRFENIVHNGTLYAAECPDAMGYVYTSTDLRAWTARVVDGNSLVMAGTLMAVGSLLVLKTQYSGTYYFRTSVDNGVTWIYQASVGGTSVLVSAGGIGYVLNAASHTDFRTVTPANAAGTVRSFTTARVWRNMLHNGTRWLVLDDSASAGEWSANGLNGWTAAAGLPAAVEKLPLGGRIGYAIGGRFVVLSCGVGKLSSVYSEQGETWHVGAMGEADPRGWSVDVIGSRGTELNGVLYIPIRVSDGTRTFSAMLATPDGVRFKWLPPYMEEVITPPIIGKRADDTGLLFNAGNGASNRFESNPDALEVYLAL